MINSICVYCASRTDIDPVYFQAAEELGRTIAEKGCTLVYGGASIGLMGATARTVKAHGGRVVGIIPEALQKHEITFREADDIIVTADLRDRKALMEKNADAFITLPGGFGTLEEVLEVITSKYLHYHHKPIILLNINGYYDPLQALFEHLFAQNFANPNYRKVYYFSDSVADAFAYLDRYHMEHRA